MEFLAGFLQNKMVLSLVAAPEHSQVPMRREEIVLGMETTRSCTHGQFMNKSNHNCMVPPIRKYQGYKVRIMGLGERLEVRHVQGMRQWLSQGKGICIQCTFSVFAQWPCQTDRLHCKLQGSVSACSHIITQGRGQSPAKTPREFLAQNHVKTYIYTQHEL